MLRLLILISLAVNGCQSVRTELAITVTKEPVDITIRMVR